jgi:hypothetical protein
VGADEAIVARRELPFQRDGARLGQRPERACATVLGQRVAFVHVADAHPDVDIRRPRQGERRLGRADQAAGEAEHEQQAQRGTQAYAEHQHQQQRRIGLGLAERAHRVHQPGQCRIAVRLQPQNGLDLEHGSFADEKALGSSAPVVRCRLCKKRATCGRAR